MYPCTHCALRSLTKSHCRPVSIRYLLLTVPRLLHNAKANDVHNVLKLPLLIYINYVHTAMCYHLRASPRCRCRRIPAGRRWRVWRRWARWCWRGSRDLWHTDCLLPLKRYTLTFTLKVKIICPPITWTLRVMTSTASKHLHWLPNVVGTISSFKAGTVSFAWAFSIRIFAW